MREFKRAARSARAGVRRVVTMTLATLLSVSGLAVLTATTADAHTQNMKVAVACKDGVYHVTYTLNYDKGVPNGDVFRRTGAKDFQNGWKPATWKDWTKVKTVTNSNGSVSWTNTLPGSTTVAPWEYSYIQWKDGYVTQGDTRPEGLKGDCKPDTPSNPPGQDIQCTYIYRDFGRALQNGDHINVTLERSNGSQFQVNVYVDRNITGGYNTLGFRYSDGTTRPLTEAEVKKGRIWLDPSSKTSESYFVIRFVQINESENWPNKTCGTPPPPATPKDAAASVTVTPATCEAPGTASVKDKKFATLVGTLDQSVGTHVATFKADTGHHFSNGSDTSQVSYTVSGRDKSLCAPKAPTADASATACVKDGEKTGLVNVTVLNTDDDTDKTVDYNVVLNGATKQITLVDGKSGSVSFDGLAVGDYTISVKGNDDTSASTTVKVTKCPVPPIVTPPPTSPPVVTPPPAPPVKVRAHAKSKDKCELRGDYISLRKQAGVKYIVNGKRDNRSIVPTKGKKRVVVKAYATSRAQVLVGKRSWTFKFTNKSCKTPPHKSPPTGM